MCTGSAPVLYCAIYFVIRAGGLWNESNILEQVFEVVVCSSRRLNSPIIQGLHSSSSRVSLWAPSKPLVHPHNPMLSPPHTAFFSPICPGLVTGVGDLFDLCDYLARSTVTYILQVVLHRARNVSELLVIVRKTRLAMKVDGTNIQRLPFQISKGPMINELDIKRLQEDIFWLWPLKRSISMLRSPKITAGTIEVKRV